MTQTKQPKTGSKSSSHTPGPWKIGRSGDFVEAPESKMGVAPHVYRHNARLIAKAPEMYELLELWPKLEEFIQHLRDKLGKRNPWDATGTFDQFSVKARRIKAAIDGEE